MTPKEKAREILNYFEPASCYDLTKHEMALFYVNEIIKSEPINPSKEDSAYSYWLEVKKEIEKL